MCRQHPLKLPETKVTAIVPTKHTNSIAIAATAGPVTPATSFVGCGLDRSCPASVTAMPNREVRLDQYQCIIGTIRGERDAKSSFHLSNNHRVEEDDDFTILDHEFEWYDLDTIRGVDTGNTTNVIGHDFRAGLVFTTERQVLNREAEANVIVVTSVSSSKNDIKTKMLELLFWTNNSSDHKKIEETSEDREFREQMEELEQEIYSDDDMSSLNSSSCSLHGE